jgi:hypothetical protein
MSEIGPKDALERFGISTTHHLMPNGETRFRLVDRDGAGYVRTEAGEAGAWQNSHLHRRMVETYIVQAGWVAVAQLSQNNELEITVLREGNVLSASPGVAHNVYMPAGAITHVVKHGTNTADDWVTSQATALLDLLTKPLLEPDILRIAKSNDAR